MTQEIAVETHVFGSRGEPRALLQPVPFPHKIVLRVLRPLAAFLAGDQGPTAMGLIKQSSVVRDELGPPKKIEVTQVLWYLGMCPESHVNWHEYDAH